MARETMDDLRAQLRTTQAELEDARATVHRLTAVLSVIRAALREALDPQNHA
jgi:hypothetical protein